MASIFDYQFNVGGNFTAAMEGMIDSTGRFRAKIEDCNNWIGKISNTFASLDMASNYVEKINGVFSGITEAGANAELQLMNLKTLFGGNAEAAEAMYERISEYGKVTPYDKAGLLEAQRTMMSFGMTGEVAFAILRQIGDIAMGDSQKLQSLALAFAQMSSTGKLTGQDLMQMINAGFNPLNEISKQTGKSVSELKEDMSKGAISVDMVSEAFRTATSEGGLFYGAIEAASNTTAGRMASIQDSIEEIKVKIFNAFGDFGLWINTISQVMIPISQILPLIMGLGKAMLWVKSLQWASMWGSIRGFLYASRIQMLLINKELLTGQIRSAGFLVNIMRATVGVVRFATVGIFQALKGLGSLLLSFITTGGASTAFATTASISFGVFKRTAVSACRAVGVAIMNIPIIGWIAAAIAGLIALGNWLGYTSTTFKAIVAFMLTGLGSIFVILWDKCEGFRAFLFGIWEVLKVSVSSVWNYIKNGALYVWGLIKPIFDKIWTWGQNLVEWVKNIPSHIYKAILSAWDYVKGLLSRAYQWLSNSIFSPIIGFFTNLYSKYVKPVLDKIVSFMGKIFNPIIELWNSVTGKAVEAFHAGEEKGRESFRKSQEEKNKKEEDEDPEADIPQVEIPTIPTTPDPTLGTLGTVGTASASTSDKIKNVTVNVEKLVERFEIHTTNMQGDMSRVKDMVSEALLSALNDVNLAM